jgi:hypothetical protein
VPVHDISGSPAGSSSVKFSTAGAALCWCKLGDAFCWEAGEIITRRAMVTKGVLVDEENQGLPTARKHGEDVVVLLQQRRRHWTKTAIVPFLALTAVQFMYAGHTTLTKVALVGGVDAFFISFYRNVLAGLFLAPFAFYLER